MLAVPIDSDFYFRVSGLNSSRRRHRAVKAADREH
jgi:hypothetical protein